MFVSLPSRRKPPPRWAAPLLFAALWLAFLWMLGRPDEARRSLWLAWGALGRGLGSGNPSWGAWIAALQDGSVLRLFTALFLHADWAHLLGNLVFLLIFGLPAERAMGPWRFLALFLAGGAIANLAAVGVIDDPHRAVLGARGAGPAVVGAYRAPFPGAGVGARLPWVAAARLGAVLPLGLFLECVLAPAFLLVGIWPALQGVFAYIGPAFGAVAWAAHVAGFLFGVLFALVVRAGIARRM